MCRGKAGGSDEAPPATTPTAPAPAVGIRADVLERLTWALRERAGRGTIVALHVAPDLYPEAKLWADALPHYCPVVKQVQWVPGMWEAHVKE